MGEVHISSGKDEISTLTFCGDLALEVGDVIHVDHCRPRIWWKPWTWFHKTKSIATVVWSKTTIGSA